VKKTPAALMAEAIALSRQGMRSGCGGPFGAVLARDGKIVGKGQNRVIADSDPTACEPCPMCLAAAYWARVERIVFANSREDAARVGFGDEFIYREIPLPARSRSLSMKRLMGKSALAVFREWDRKSDKVPYGPDIPEAGTGS
jgi:guanine deaminase